MPSALSRDTDFDVSSSPAASPSQEDRLAPTSAKKAKQQGIRLHTEAQRDELLGHSLQSDISDREEDTSDQGHQPANGSELQSSTDKVTDSTAKMYREHVARKGMTSTTTTTTSKPTPKAKRQLSLPKPHTPEGGSVYDKNSK